MIVFGKRAFVFAINRSFPFVFVIPLCKLRYSAFSPFSLLLFLSLDLFLVSQRFERHFSRPQNDKYAYEESTVTQREREEHY